MNQPCGTQGQMYWYHYNRKGDVVGLTKQNGNSHHNYRYDPYGAVLPENGNFTDPHNHYTLTGKEFDENTGLVWFGARHYETETGVWMGQDVYRGEKLNPKSLHRYLYNYASPVNYVDYTGNFGEAVTAVSAGFAVDLAVPEPSDVVPYKWAGWGVAYLGAAAVDVSVYAYALVDKSCDPTYKEAKKAKDREHKRYKKRCHERPPTGLNKCEKWMWLLQRNKDCKKMRQDWDNKWQPGRHQKSINEYQRSIIKLEDKINRLCN